MSTPLFLARRFAFVVGVANHAATVRLTYTVPAGQRAVLQFAQIALIEQPGPGLNQINYYLTVGGVIILFDVNRGAPGYLHQELQNDIDLAPGETVTITTLNTTAVLNYFVGSFVVREYQ